MAVTAQIKVNIDANQGIKSVGTLNNELKETTQISGDLKSQLRSMTIELQGLEPGTKRFNELSIAAGELKDRIGDTNAVIKATAGSVSENMGTALAGVAGVGISAFQGITAAQALFGVESEEVTKTLMKLQALAGLSDAVKSMGALGDTFTEIRSAMTAAATKLGIFTAAKEVDVVVTEGQIIATEGATLATKGLGTAMKALPIVAIVAGIAALVGAFMSYNSKSAEAEALEKKRAAAAKAAAAAAKEETDAVSKESGEFVGLIYQLKATNKGSKERATLMKQINGNYGTTLQNLSDETAFQASLNEAVQDYIDLQYNKFKLQKNQKYIDQQLAKQYEAEQKMNKAKKEAQEQVDSGLRRSIEDVFSYREDLRELYAEGEKGQQEAIAQLEKLGARRGVLKGQQDDLTEGGKKYIVTQTDVNKVDKESVEINDELIKKLKELVQASYDRNHNEEDRLRNTLANDQAEIEAMYSKTAKTIEDTKNRDAALKLLEEKFQADLAAIQKKAALKTKSEAVIAQETYMNQLRLKIMKTGGLEQLAYQAQLYQAEKDLMDIQMAEELAMVENNEIEKAAIEAKYALKKAEFEVKTNKETNTTTSTDDSKSFEEKLNKASAIADYFAGVATQMTDNISEMQNRRAEQDAVFINDTFNASTIALQQQLDDRLITQEEYDAQFARLEQQKAQDELAARRKSFEQQKKLQIVNATIQGITATLAAYASGAATPILGVVTGPVYAGIAAAFSAMQVGMISSQQFRAARGGVVPGNGPGNVDSVNSLLAPGETVINSASSKAFMPLLSAINQSGGGIPLMPDMGPSNGPQIIKVYNDNSTPIQAYVTEQQVTSTQNTIRNIKRRSKLF